MKLTTSILLTYKCESSFEKTVLEKIMKRPLLEKDIIIITQEELTELKLQTSKPISLKKIKALVYNYYNIIESKSRQHEFVKARQIAHYLSKKHTSYSLSEISAEIGNNSHATVLYSDKMIKEKLTYDKKLNVEIRFLTQELELLTTKKIK